MRLPLALALAGLAASPLVVRAQPIAPRVDGIAEAPVTSGVAAVRPDTGAVMADLRWLAHADRAGRAPETGGSAEARRFVERRFRQLGLEAFADGYVQPFTYAHRRDSSTVVAANVVGVLRGSVHPDSVIVVTAHYDHVGTSGGSVFHGADDNASGVAGLLAAAAYFARHRPQRTLVFVALDAEERGLQGARHFVAQPPVPLAHVRLNVNLDMIGRADAGAIYVAGTSYTPRLRPVVEAATAGIDGLAVRFGHDTPGTGRDDWTGQSDHAAFHRAGVPFLYFGVEDHPDYHRPTDTSDKIRPETLASTVEAVVRTLVRLDEAGTSPDGR